MHGMYQMMSRKYSEEWEIFRVLGKDLWKILLKKIVSKHQIKRKVAVSLHF